MAGNQNRTFEAPKAEEVRQKIASVLSQLSPRSETELNNNVSQLPFSGSAIQDILNQKRQAFERRLRNPNEPNQTIFINSKVVEFKRHLDDKDAVIRSITHDRTMLMQENQTLREEIARLRSGVAAGGQVGVGKDGDGGDVQRMRNEIAWLQQELDRTRSNFENDRAGWEAHSRELKGVIDSLSGRTDQGLLARLRDLEGQLAHAHQVIQTQAVAKDTQPSDSAYLAHVKELEGRLAEADRQVQQLNRSKTMGDAPFADPQVQARIRSLEANMTRVVQEHQAAMHKQQSEAADYKKRAESQIQELSTAVLSAAKKDVDNILISKLKSFESQLQIQDQDMKNKVRLYEQQLANEKARNGELETKLKAANPALLKQRESDLKQMEALLLQSSDRIRQLEQQVHALQSTSAPPSGQSASQQEVQLVVNQALRQQADDLSRRHLDEVLSLQKQIEELKRAPPHLTSPGKHQPQPKQPESEEVARLHKRIEELEGHLSSLNGYKSFAQGEGKTASQPGKSEVKAGQSDVVTHLREIEGMVAKLLRWEEVRADNNTQKEFKDLAGAADALNEAELKWVGNLSNPNLEQRVWQLRMAVRTFSKKEGKPLPPTIPSEEEEVVHQTKLLNDLKVAVKRVVAEVREENQGLINSNLEALKAKAESTKIAAEKDPKNVELHNASEKAKLALASADRKSGKKDEVDKVRKAEKKVHQLIVALEKSPKNPDLEKQLHEAEAEVERHRAKADESKIDPETGLKQAEEALKLAREAALQKPDNQEQRKAVEQAEKRLRRAFNRLQAKNKGEEWSGEDEDDMLAHLLKKQAKLDAKTKKLAEMRQKLESHLNDNQHPLLQGPVPRRVEVKIGANSIPPPEISENVAADVSAKQIQDLTAKLANEDARFRKEIEVREWQVQDLTAQLETLLEASKLFEKTKADLEGHLTVLSRENGVLKTANTDLEKKFAAEDAAKTAALQETTAKLSAAEKKADEASKGLADAQSKVAALEKERDVLKGEREGLKKLVTESQDHSTKTVKAMDEKTAEVTRLETKLGASEKSIEDLKKRLQAQEEEAARRQQQLIQAANEKGAKEASELHQKFLDDLNTENTRLKTALRELENALLIKDKDLEKADKARKKVDDEMVTMKDYVRTVEEKIALLESNNRDNAEIADRTIVEKKALEKKVDEVTKAKDKAEADLKALEAKGKQWEAEVAKGKSDVEARNNEIHRLVERTEADGKELERLRAAVKAVEDHKAQLEISVAAFKKAEEDRKKEAVTAKDGESKQLKQAEEAAKAQVNQLTAELAKRDQQIKALETTRATYEEALMESASEIHGVIASLPSTFEDLKRKSSHRDMTSGQAAKELRQIMREMIDALRKDSEMTTQVLREEHGVLSNDVTELKKELEKRHEENNYLRKMLEEQKQGHPESKVSTEALPELAGEVEELRSLLAGKEEENEALRNEVAVFGQKFDEINSEYMEKLRTIVEPLKGDENFGEDIERIEQMFEEIANSYPEGVSSEEFGYVLMNLKMAINEFFQRYLNLAETKAKERPKIAVGHGQGEGEGEDEEEESPEQKIENLTALVIELEANKNELVTEVETRDERIQELEDHIQQIGAQLEEYADQVEELKKDNDDLTEQLNAKKPPKQVEVETKLKKEIAQLRADLKAVKKEKGEVEKAAAEYEEELQKKEEEIENIKTEVANAFEEEQNNFNQRIQEQDEVIKKLTEELEKAQVGGGRAGRSKESFKGDEKLQRQLTEAQEEIQRLHTEYQDADKKVSKAERGYDHLREKYEKLQSAYKQLKAGSALAAENKELRDRLAAMEQIQKEVDHLKSSLEKAKRAQENERARVVQLEKEKESRVQEYLNMPDLAEGVRRELTYKTQELKKKEAELHEATKMVEVLQRDFDRMEDEASKLKDGLTRRNRIIKKLRANIGADSVAKDSELASELDMSTNLDDLDLGGTGNLRDSAPNSQVFLRSEKDLAKEAGNGNRNTQPSRSDKPSAFKMTQSAAIPKKR